MSYYFNEIISSQPQSSQADDEQWTSLHNGLVTSLREYLSSIATFADVYKKVRCYIGYSLMPFDILFTLLLLTW